MDDKKIELYFHIPFCVRKCLYCDFLSAPADASVQDAYMEALLRETSNRAKEYREYRVDTVFIGGGTPSVVDAKWIRQLLETVSRHYQVAENAEITMEINPGTVDARKLQTYYEAGINRLSIGLQSVDDEELRRLGRIHTWEEFCRTYDDARAAGFVNVNVDVMSALPGQSLASYGKTLEKVLALTPQPEHISAYSLIVEEGTPFAGMYEKGQLDLPDEDCERQMYEQTEEVLKRHGYTRYEISNYAKAGYACRHNLGYWKRANYVGFGIGAASLVENERFRNGERLEEYLVNPLGCLCDRQRLTAEEQMEEFMFLGLRMTEGVSKEAFAVLFGRSMDEVYGEVIARNLADGLLLYSDVSGNREGDEVLVKQEKPLKETRGRRLALTKRGMDLSNYVMAQFLLD